MSFDDHPGAAPADRATGFVLGPDEGDAYSWLGSLSINKLTGASTRNGVDIVDHRVPPGYAPPLHVHSISDEVFYILAGQFAVTCGDDHWTAGPGSLVFLPRGIPHGFTVSGDGPGKTLLINAPAGFSEVISELGDKTTTIALPPKDAPMPPPERIGEVSAAHGIHNPWND